MPTSRFAVLLLATLSSAQDPTVGLPALPRLGPLPPAVTLDLDHTGELRVAGKPVARDQLPALLREARDVVVAAPADLAIGRLGDVVASLRGAGMHTVHFAAQLPTNHANGAFAVALTDPGRTADLEVDLTFARPGVPPTSVIPLLQRIADGLPPERRPDWSIAVTAPAATTLGALLQVLAALELAGAPPTVMRWPTNASAVANARVPAIDLGPAPLVQVPATPVPLPRPELLPGPVGLPAPTDAGTILPDGGGAGGRYGGRAGRRVQARGTDGESIARGLAFVERSQLPGGGWPDAAGNPEVELTSWVLLSLLGNGHHLDADVTGKAVARAAGFLLTRQDSDGALGGTGPGSVRRHALAAYALIEASGLSGRGLLLRGHATAALQWLASQELPSGGWNDGTPGAAKDTMATVHAAMAIESARFFRLPVHVDAATLLAALPSPDVATLGTEAAAATLFARCFLGEDPRTHTATLGALQEAPLAEPRSCYWITYALFQGGGRHWAEWSRRMATLAPPRTDGPSAGSWDPAPGMDRITTSALRVLTLEAWHRYARLVR